MDEALWVARVGVSDVTVLAGIAAPTSDFTNGAKACFEDCSNRNFFKVCVLNLKPSCRNIIMWQT